MIERIPVTTLLAIVHLPRVSSPRVAASSDRSRAVSPGLRPFLCLADALTSIGQAAGTTAAIIHRRMIAGPQDVTFLDHLLPRKLHEDFSMEDS